MARRLGGRAVTSGAATPATWAAMLAEMIRDQGREPMLAELEDGAWQPTSWRAFGEARCRIALAAIGQGFGHGDIGCILGATSGDWLTIDAGLVSIGMISAGVYPTEPPERLAYILNDSGARLLFVDSEIQLAKARAVADICPALQLVVTVGFRSADGEREGEVALADWLDRHPADPSAFDAASARVEPGDGAILIYTSGTTGPPKGALISQGAIAWQVDHSARLYFPERGWVRPAFLPLCHIGERYFTFFGMRGGAVAHMVPEPSTLGALLPGIRPQFILAVPRVYEKLREAFAALSADLGIAGLDGALSRGFAIAAQHLSGADVPVTLDHRPAADARALLAARRAIGLDRAELLVSGGASFAPDLLRWFLALGIPMLEMYGMSETGTIASNLPGAIREASVGPVCDFAEVAIRPDGQIAVRGPGLFNRYWNKPEATASAFDGDWFLTGDIGRLDDQGHLRIVGRLKDIFITSGGKNIAPAEIEARLRHSPFIQDAAAIGDGRKFVSALLIIDEAAVRRALDVTGDLAQLARNPDALALLEAEVAAANATLSHVEQVKRFRILPRALGADSPELTPTLKLKRAALFESFADLIEEIYAP